jgi:hypothetical protein
MDGERKIYGREKWQTKPILTRLILMGKAATFVKRAAFVCSNVRL